MPRPRKPKPYFPRTGRIKRSRLTEELLAYLDFRFAVADVLGYANILADSRERMSGSILCHPFDDTDRKTANDILKDAAEIRAKVKRVKDLLAEFKPSDRAWEEIAPCLSQASTGEIAYHVRTKAEIRALREERELLYSLVRRQSALLVSYAVGGAVDTFETEAVLHEARVALGEDDTEATK